MKMYSIKLVSVLMLATYTRSDDVADTTFVTDDTCGLRPWEAALEDWATADRGNNSRHGRIMSLAPTQGYYVSDRIDLVPPPPPPPRPQHAMSHRGPYPAHQAGPTPHNTRPHGLPPQPSGPSNSHNTRPQSHHSASASPLPYDEWQATPPPPPGAGKIVNRPPNPYKDQFKPSFPPPSQSIPVQSVADRVDTAPPPPPHKQVSETDVYLLRAIEKLVYRVDLMEKRLRKMEENLLYVVAGTEAKPEPCPANFTRIGGGCYHISSDMANWKGASFACRRLQAHLLELGGGERGQFVHGVLADNRFKGSDFWTGGLNPGLLWIWAHSAKPVVSNTTTDQSSIDIAGEGRCLALIHSPPTDYVYKGQDCTLRHRYVCERHEDKEKLGNEIERVARKLREGKRKPKIMWTDDDS